MRVHLDQSERDRQKPEHLAEPIQGHNQHRGDDERASQRFARVGNEDREEEDSNRDVDYAKAPSGPSRRHGGEGINLERFVERIKSP
jgi:hypothetical protein